MVDESTPSNQQSSLEDSIKIALSRRGIGDTTNNFAPTKMELDVSDPTTWTGIESVKTYESYIREKYRTRPELADAVLLSSDATFVLAYDAAMQKINAAITAGITSEQQARNLKDLFNEAQRVVTEFCRTI